jgi:hypothetical protein
MMPDRRRIEVVECTNGWRCIFRCGNSLQKELVYERGNLSGMFKEIQKHLATKGESEEA